MAFVQVATGSVGGILCAGDLLVKHCEADSDRCCLVLNLPGLAVCFEYLRQGEQ